ncbi:carboxyl transferase domain-containing protein [Bacteriovorax sp. DB6_IX]|uniref:carboxyl transferase domain-containing protein n=1 Tax=Bacteriovorax sp. DB6_IX TaxID=1353530 RepID=UPI00038A234A|nr:carboxyl transferase domain-containing protein [Bacteriovorax sp. DB6_IX]EQC50673.1 carboxyl transferase domain protein [Bacteriovorax sp. DB6_IX]
MVKRKSRRLGLNPIGWIEEFSDSGKFEYLYSNEEVSVMTGIAKVRGEQVAFYAHRPSVNQGFVCSRGADAIADLIDHAFEKQIPIVAFMASPGVSVDEGIVSGDHYTKVITRNIKYSGVIPQISVIIGTTMGAPAYSATMTDFVLFNKARSTLMVTGPAVIEKVLGEKTTIRELGGSEVHASKTGIADFVDKDIATQISRAKRLVSFLPQSNISHPQKRLALQASGEVPVIPRETKTPFDIIELVNSIVDNSEFMSFKHSYGPSLYCLFAYIEGRPVGIMANNSFIKAGALDCESASKSSRFLKLCDAYNIPIITLIDVPGFMPGSAQEHHGLLRFGAQLCQSMQTNVPRLSVVVRKCYGAAAFILMQTRNQGGDVVLALENSRVAIMGLDGAHSMLEERGIEVDEQSYFDKYERPEIALENGIVDEIVATEDIRERLAHYLSLAKNKEDYNKLEQRHLIIP